MLASDTYKKAADYWSGVPATVDGVLGGFGFISNVDIEGSRVFLEYLLSIENAPKTTLALDCGAGIGRISKGLLLPVFGKVDLVEQNPNFLNVAEEYISEHKDKLGMLYPVGLQDFKPEKKYDMIWCQWVLGHLTDDDLVNFFNICRSALGENGIIVVKENVTSSGKVEKDDEDSSVTRSLKLLLNIFKRAKLKRIKECKQTNFPKGIYPVYMFALIPQPKESTPMDSHNLNNTNDDRNASTKLVKAITKLNFETEKIQNAENI